MNAMARALGWLIWKDWLTERRAKERLLQMVTFAIVMVVIFQVTLPLGTPVHEMLPSILWITVTFAGMLGLNHSFSLERENDCMQGLLLCPVPRSVIYVGKMISNLAALAVTEVILLPLVMIFFNLSPGPYLYLLGLVCALGTGGLAIVGTLFAAMTANTKIREVLLPLLVLPLLLPALIAAVRVTGQILAGALWADVAAGLKFLLVFDLMFFGLAVLMFEYIVESE